MPKFNLLKGHNNSLKPGDEQAEQWLNKVPFAEPVVCTLTRPRNPEFHRKFFSLLQLVFENQERYDNFERFRKEIVMRAGFYEEHVHLTGKVSYVAKSLAFDKMDALEFEALYDKCCEVIIQYFWPDISKHHLEEAVLDYMKEYTP
jgi:hypothetical protein